MAQQPLAIEFEDVPLDEARRMSRGPRLALELYNALKQTIQSRDNAVTRLALPEGASPTTLKNCIFRVGAELHMPVTVRQISGGLLFGRSTDEDRQQAKAVTQRWHTAQRTGRVCPGRRRA